MGEFLPFLVVTGALAAVMGLFTWLACVVRRRGLAGAAVRTAMASYEEAFRVTAHDSHYENRRRRNARCRWRRPAIRGGRSVAGPVRRARAGEALCGGVLADGGEVFAGG